MVSVDQLYFGVPNFANSVNRQLSSCWSSCMKLCGEMHYSEPAMQKPTLVVSGPREEDKHCGGPVTDTHFNNQAAWTLSLPN